MTSHAMFLFSRPSFAEGVSRLADFRGVLNVYRTSATPAEADELALWHDWQEVREELAKAVAALSDT